MNQSAIQVQLGSLPIILVCFSNRDVLLAPAQQFRAIIDQPEQGGRVQAIFDMSGFSLFEEDVAEGLNHQYNISMSLDDSPLLQKYLGQQDLTL